MVVLVEQCWLDLPKHYQNCSLDSYVIMPNHFHGIVAIEAWNGYKPFPTEHKVYDLSEIIRGFKTFSSRKIHETGLLEFGWQGSFYDHIIRKDESLDAIREYIINNPKKWELDKENPKNILNLPVWQGLKPYPTFPDSLPLFTLGLV